LAGEKAIPPVPVIFRGSHLKGVRVLSFSNVIATQHVAWKTDVLGPMVCFRDREVGAQMLKIGRQDLLFPDIYKGVLFVSRSTKGWRYSLIC
jgi:hypothetical protein